MLQRNAEKAAVGIAAYTVASAAAELGVTTACVYKWLRAGLLTQARLAAGRTKLVTQESVLALKAQRQVAS